MTIQYRPAVRAEIPCIVGLSGPSKSGKTKSAHRLAKGMANGGKVLMLNTEGPKGHLYADQFSYDTFDLAPPFTPERYLEALLAAKALAPAVLIIDSASHMHDGPGGMLEYHDAEVTRMAGNDYAKRERVNMAGWIKPKAAENAFIEQLLLMPCSTILCFRAKEKLLVKPGQQPKSLGWQPIASDRMTFETLFTLTLPPYSKGIPDLEQSELRDGFDRLVRADRQIDEELGRRIAAEAARGGTQQEVERVSAPVPAQGRAPSVESRGVDPGAETSEQHSGGNPDPFDAFWKEVRRLGFGRNDVIRESAGVEVPDLDDEARREILARLTERKGQAA